MRGRRRGGLRAREQKGGWGKSGGQGREGHREGLVGGKEGGRGGK